MNLTAALVIVQTGLRADAQSRATYQEAWQMLLDSANRIYKDNAPPPPLECWSVIQGAAVLQSYSTEHMAQDHANYVTGGRVIRMREVV